MKWLDTTACSCVHCKRRLYCIVKNGREYKCPLCNTTLWKE